MPTLLKPFGEDTAGDKATPIGLAILSGLCLIVDGYDVQAMGYVGPAIVQDWRIHASQLGPVFGAGLFGVLIGSLLLSTAADRFGRRRVLLLSTLLSGVFTLATATAGSMNALLAMRFIAGVGFGGVFPNVVALMGEHSPARLRSSVMMFVACGFTAGAALGGFLASALIPAFGWRSVFYVGGGAPLLLFGVLLFVLPESLHLESRRIPVVDLLTCGRAWSTVLLWTINFMNLLDLYFLSSWLPTIAKSAGQTTASSILTGATLQLGGIVGTIVIAGLVQKLGFVPVLATCFAMASLNIAVIGWPTAPPLVVFGAVFVAGLCVVGGQIATIALAGSFYPAYLRSTGIGWGLGIGRIGAILGPVWAGRLIRLHWPPRALFITAAVPMLLSAVAIVISWFLKTATPEAAYRVSSRP